ncbi:MAG TPA: glutathione binding-like protein [Nevskia sp.]|jgi:glutathione S-transferase|nr:glutathione binding-like protein [Nevskia sp.]
MKLYFSPLACSLASRIVFYEAGATAEYVYADTKAKRLEDGSDFLAVNPMGQVPVLETADGSLLTENTAILQYLAEQLPQARLAPAGSAEQAQLRKWLGFVGTELHKAVYVPLLDAKAPDAVKAYARDKIPLRMGVLQQHLDGREFLLDRFSVADAYLATVLNWSAAVGLKLAPWPAVDAYYQRLLQRPALGRAVREEFALYQQEQQKARAPQAAAR